MEHTQEEQQKHLEKARAEDAKDSSWIENLFEGTLWRSRFLVILAVISSLLGSMVLFIIGSLDMIDVLLKTWGY